MIESNPVILYIEDNPDNRKLVNRVLQAADFEVVTVNDGIEGFAYLKGNIPDLILMDMQLPEIDGYSMTKQLRQNPTLNHVPIIALTANVLKEDKDRSFAAGCNGFIHKPIDVDLLPHQVISFLNKSKVE